MGQDLFGKQVLNTYDAIIKVGDNDTLTGIAKQLSDGRGNDTPIWLSTARMGIGITPDTNYTLTVNGAAKIGSLDVTGAVTAASVQLTGGSGNQGLMSWNTDEETVDIIQNGATLQVGQEVQVHVKNQTGALIPDGTPVYVTGTLGSSGRLTVAPMIADGSIEAKYFLGITTEDIGNGEDGKVTTFGKIRGLNTSAYSEGTTLYVSASTAGAFQTTAPVAPNLDLEVAIVINSHVNNGTIFVRAQQGYYLGLLHDVYLNSPANNQFLVYNSTTSRWENQGISSVGSINLDTVTDNGNTTTNNINVGDITAGNMTLSGYLRGAANFVIDPAAYGDETGVVQILGDLRVDGTTTTINSTTVTVNDKNIVLASGSATAADANGAGITIDGAAATMLYNSTSDRFVFNKDIQTNLVGNVTGDVTGNLTGDVTGNVTGNLTGNADTASALATARNIAVDGAVTGNADFDGSGDITITTTVNHNHDADYVNLSGDTMTGQLLGVGTLSNTTPAFAFSGDSDTGLSRIADNAVGLIAGGSRKFYVNATTAYFQNLTGGVEISGSLTADGIVLTDDIITSADFSATDNRFKLTLTQADAGTIEASFDDVVLSTSMDADYVPYVSTAGGDGDTTNAILSQSWLKFNSDTLELGTVSGFSVDSKTIKIGKQVGVNDQWITEYGAREIVSSISSLSGSATAKIEFTTAGRIQFNDEYTFPATDGTSGQVLGTNGSGDLSWVSGAATTSDLQVVTDNGNITDNNIIIESADPTLVLRYNDAVNNANSGRIHFVESPTSVTHFEIQYDGATNELRFNSPIDGTTDRFKITRGGNATASGTMTATTFIGALQGNADTATDADTLDTKHATDFTLQYVTDNGNTTTNSISIGKSTAPASTLDVDGQITSKDIVVDFNTGTLSHGVIFRGVASSAGEVGIRANGEAFEIYEPEQSNKVWLSIADDPEGNGIAAQLNSPSGFTPILTNYNKGDYITKSYIDGLNVDADTLDGLDSTSFFIDGDTVINMANNDGFVYDDANNVMKVKYDGNEYDILTAANHTSFTDPKYLRSDQDDTTTGALTIQKGLLDATFLNLLNQNTSGDISQQRSFIDFTYVDSNTNETPQVRIGAEVGQNGDADSQIKEGSGAFVVYTNNADTDAGIAGASLAERFRVDYLGRVGINNNTPFAKLQITGASQANGHYDDAATVLAEDNECRFQLLSTNDGNDASTIMLTNVQSSTDNRHWVIGHRGPSRSNRFEIGYVASTASGNIGTGGYADFVIDTSGRVGVGIDAPSEQFEVNGDVRIYGSGSTIGGATVGNASLLIGSPTSGIGIDDNEIHSTGAMYIGTNSSNLVLRPADAVLINTTTTTGAAKLLVNGFLSTGSSAVAQFKGFIRAEGQLFLHHDSNNSNAARILYDGTNGLSFTTEGTGSNNFGIATTAPEELLHVNGTIKAEGTIKIDDGATGNPYLALYQSGTEKAYFQYVDSGDNLVIQSDGAISLRTGSSSKLHIPLSGEVGIGCDDPQTLLEIRGNAPFLTISNFQENDGGIYFNDYQAGANPATSAQAASIKWSSSDNKMRICNNDANNLAIGIDMEGDVGIGTDSPTGKFNSYISAARQLTHNGNGGDLSIISDNNSAPVMYVKGTGSADLLNVYANTVEVFNIAASGNLSVYSATNGVGAKINFSDNRPTVTQFGTMEYTHLNTQSYGQGEAFKFYGSETSMAFHVAGIGLFTGDVTAFYSDMRLKTKLGNIENPIEKIQALSGFYYEPNEVAQSYGYEKERRLGLSAQEVKEVLPEAVSDAAIGDGYMSVDYAKLVPVLVEAIKEQQKQIDELKSKLDGITN